MKEGVSMRTKTTQRFGFWSIVLLTINGIIGTGIFLSPAGVIKVAGTKTPLVYIVAALFAGVLAVVFAAASKYTTKNGSSYAYAKVALGSNVGFYIGVTRYVATTIAWGVVATAVVETSFGIFGIEKTRSNITIGFIALMVILLAICFSGTYVTKIFNNLSTIGKVGALVLAIVGGLVIFLSTGENHFSEVNQLRDNAGQLLIKPMTGTVFFTAVVSAFYAFAGFETVSAAASELEEPEKNLPRAIPLAIVIIALIYLSVVSIAMVINPTAVMKSTEPVILASAYSNVILKKCIIYGALLSMFGINIVGAFSTPRVFESMAAEGQIPEFLCKRTKRGVPVYAFLITAVLAIVVPMSFNYDMRDILIISSVARFLQFLVVPIAVIVFYKGKNAEPALPAKKNFITDVIIPIFGLLLTCLLLLKFDWVGQFTHHDGTANVFAIVAMIVGYVVLPILLYIPMKMGLYRKHAN